MIFNLVMGAVLVIIATCMAFSAKEELPKELKTSTILIPFYRTASRIERKLHMQKSGTSVRKMLCRRILTEKEEKLGILEPASDRKSKGRNWFIQKTGLSLLLITVGTLMALLLSYKESSTGQLVNGRELIRGYGQYEDYKILLNAVMGEEELEDVEVYVASREYSNEEIQQMLPDFHDILEMTVLSDNESAEHVNKDLNLVTKLDGYPFQIRWEIDGAGVIDRYGQLLQGIPTEGKMVGLTAEISYEDYMEDYTFYVMVFPKEQSIQEQYLNALTEALNLQANETSTEKYFSLPDEVNGIKVVWQEKKKRNAILLFAFVLIAGAGVFIGYDKDLDKKIKERALEMTSDYPETVSKLALLIGAGMTVRNAWRKMSLDYLTERNAGKPKHYVYEEMLYTMYEMESGIGEMQAYQHFATRCRVQRYVKLISLLEQNVKMGAKGFLESLQKEAGDALEEKKSKARKLGEEAGTKLLVPMILMLLIVMVVIMVPAFMTI